MYKKPRLAAALALAGALTLTGCGMNATTGAQAPLEPGASAMSSPAPESGSIDSMDAMGSMESMIHLQDGMFHNPKPLPPGATVTVMNMDATTVVIVADDSNSFKVTVEAGGVANFEAPKKAGSYPFHSTTEGMTGVLTVQAEGPSAAAEMVCADVAKVGVRDILSLSELPKTSENWDGKTFSCTYPLTEGRFVMSVTESVNDAEASALAEELAGSHKAAPIKGLANLGLPGYQSDSGTVIFAKDNMTLHVDATTLSSTVGPDQVTPSKFAYEMATTILGCWTAHH